MFKRAHCIRIRVFSFFLFVDVASCLQLVYKQINVSKSCCGRWACLIQLLNPILNEHWLYQLSKIELLNNGVRKWNFSCHNWIDDTKKEKCWFYTMQIYNAYFYSIEMIYVYWSLIKKKVFFTKCFKEHIYIYNVYKYLCWTCKFFLIIQYRIKWQRLY